MKHDKGVLGTQQAPFSFLHLFIWEATGAAHMSEHFVPCYCNEFLGSIFFFYGIGYRRYSLCSPRNKTYTVTVQSDLRHNAIHGNGRERASLCGRRTDT